MRAVILSKSYVRVPIRVFVGHSFQNPVISRDRAFI